MDEMYEEDPCVTCDATEEECETCVWNEDNFYIEEESKDTLGHT